MKINVIKQGTATAKPSNYCPYLIDDVPLTTANAKPSNYCPFLIDDVPLKG